jgi:pimeloyl-ACP methyl ester carboxylesterase
MADLYRSPEGERRVRVWCAERLGDWPVPHRTTSVESSLGETALVEAGDGDTVCVYLPGTNFNAATSPGILGRLADRCRVVAVDLPGQPGLSSSTRPRPEAAGYGRWLDEVLAGVRAANPGRRILVMAHSRGAAVALAGPTEVDGLVLVSPAGLAGVRTTGGLLRAAVPWMMRPSEPRSRALLTLMSAPGTDPDPALVSWLTLVARDTRSTGAPGPLPATTLDRWRDLPVRVLVGEHDCFFPPERVGRAASERLGVPVEVLPGVGHLAVEEAPERVAETAITPRPGPPGR